MAKILFLQDAFFEYHGIQSLSAYAKGKGHQVELIVCDGMKKEAIYSQVQKADPQLLAFSVTSLNYQWAVEVAGYVKSRKKILSIFGGAHPTYYPSFIEMPVVDIICVGEGEEALSELADNLDAGRDIAAIKNLWVKTEKGIRKNELRPLIQNLDELPFPDRDIYYSRSATLRGLSNKRFLAGRGCPYSCSFCHNHKLRGMYGGKGQLVRFRSAGSMIKEIAEVKDRYGLKTISFSADTFTLNPDLPGFLEVYKEKVGLPFFCQANFNELNEEKIKKLKESGCLYLAIGVESGSERLRNRILNKNLTDEKIVGVARLLKKYDLKFIAYVMFGLPTETLSDSLKTMEFCAGIGADRLAPSIYWPIAGTRLYEYIERNDLFEKRPAAVLSHYSYDSRVKFRDKAEILNLHKIAFYGVRFPALIPFIKALIKLPANPVFKLLSDYGLFDAYRVSRGMSVFEMAKLGWNIRKMT